MSYYAPELALPTFPFDHPATEASRTAKELHDLAAEATARVRGCERAAGDALQAVQLAEQALEAEIQRGAQSGVQGPAEGKLLRKLAECRDAADPGLHERRHEHAVVAQRAVVGAYQAWVGANLADLLAELEPAAVKAAEALRIAVEATGPARMAREAVAVRVDALIGTVMKSHDQRAEFLLPAEQTAPPFPDAAAIERFDRSSHPERYAAIPEPDSEPELEAVGTPGWNA